MKTLRKMYSEYNTFMSTEEGREERERPASVGRFLEFIEKRHPGYIDQEPPFKELMEEIALMAATKVLTIPLKDLAE